MRDRDDAQRRVKQIRAFQAELAALKASDEFPLTPQQESAIARYHDRVLGQLAAEFDVDASDAAGQLSRGMRLLSFFGAVALTAAVYSLVERFWGRIDLREQAALLAAFPLMALVGVELSARRERTLYVSSLFAVVAYGTFWLAIGVLSWRLNIPVTAPFIWAGVVFGFGLAIPYGFRLVLGAALVSLAIALAATMFSIAGVEWPELFNRLDLLMMAGFSLLLLAGPLTQLNRAFAPVTRLVACGVGFVALLVLSASGSNSAAPINARVVEAVYQGVMLVACVATLVVAIRHGWHETVSLVTVVFALFLLIRYVDWFWDLLPRYLFFLMLAALAFAWLMALRRVRRRLAEGRA